MTLIVNLYAGPNAGKTTLAHMIIAQLKSMRPAVSVEMAAESAKDLVYEERATALGIQEFILGEQRMRIERLIGKVDVVVTDAPIANSAIYLPKSYPSSFVDFVLWASRLHPSFEIFVERLPHPYDPIGRYHTESQALELDQKIKNFLISNNFGPLHLAQSTPERAYGLALKIIDHALKERPKLFSGRNPDHRPNWSQKLP